MRPRSRRPMNRLDDRYHSDSEDNVDLELSSFRFRLNSGRGMQSQRNGNGGETSFEPRQSAHLMVQNRHASSTTFQTHLANYNTFSNALEGVELDQPRPDATYIENSTMEGRWPFLLRLKVNTFGIALGFAAQALLWGAIASSNRMMDMMEGRNYAHFVQWIFWVFGVILLAMTLLAYAAKAVLYWGAVQREWAHPIRSSFFFAPLLAAMTLLNGQPYSPLAVLDMGGEVPLSAFIILSACVLIMETKMYGKWLFNQSSSLKKANPTYQMSVIGNFLASSMGTRVRGSDLMKTICGELSLFFFAVGTVYQLMVFFAVQNNSAFAVTSNPSEKSEKERVESETNAHPDSQSGGSSIGGTTDMSELSNDSEGSHGLTAGILERTQQVTTVDDGHGDSRGGVDGFMPHFPGPTVTRPTFGMSSDSSEHEAPAASVTVPSVVGGRRPRSVTGVRDMQEYDRTSTPSRSTEEVNWTRKQPIDVDSTTTGGQPKPTRKSELDPMRRRQVVPNPEKTPAMKKEVDTCSKKDIGAPLPISHNLHPIFFLFVAPPAAGALAWAGIAGEFDSLAKCLYFISLFMYVFLVVGHGVFFSKAGFSLAWWAYAFPSATFATATLAYAAAHKSSVLAAIGLFMGGASTALAIIVFCFTVRAACEGKLFTTDMVVAVRLDSTTK